MNLIEQLDYLFNPHAVAVVGASNSLNKWGGRVFKNLLATRGNWELYAINREEAEVLGTKSYRSIEDVPGSAELAIIIVPPASVPQVMEDCVRKEVKVAIVITAGFAESGEDGARLEQEMVVIARRGGLRFLGPNCNGFLDTASGIYTTLPISSANKGGIGFISQSGNLGMGIIRYGEEMGLGFSKFISTGNEADLHFEDFLEYLGQDKETKVIIGYIEGLREGKRFLSLAKEITRKKPIVVLKLGVTTVGGKAACSHTAALSGTEEVCNAAFKQAGVIRVGDVTELIDTAGALLRQPIPRGNRVGILAGGGGFAVVAAESCAKLNLEVAPLSPLSIEKLNAILPPRWSHSNPVDTVGTGVNDPLRPYSCLCALMEDENIDAVLAPSSIGISYLVTAEASKAQGSDREESRLLSKVIELMDRLHKPFITCHMFPEVLWNSPAFKRLRELGIMAYPTPEQATQALAHLVEYSEYLRG